MTEVVVGIVGAGQLARMTAAPAIALGVRLRVLAETADDPAAQVIPDVVLGDYRDLETLRRFAKGCDVITFDHEHVPTEHLRALQDDGIQVRPGPDALVHAQDKLVMRERLAAITRGAGVPRWVRVETAGDLDDFVRVAGGPSGEVVLKTARGGYDGRGVRLVSGSGQALDWLAEGVPLLAEERVPFRRELAVLAARSPSGQAAVYPVVESLQVNGICREVVAAAPLLDEAHALAAQEVALEIARELDVVGVMAVEMFETADGVLVNELAMRPHNTGHWTIEGAATSQFEQHLRAVLDMPLGSPAMLTDKAVMVNVLGGDLPDFHPAFAHVMARDPGLKIHLYGKEVRPGRKVGHVTVLGHESDSVSSLLERGRHAAGYLTGEIDE